MQQIFPKELLDIIFTFSDIKTKRTLKKLCKVTYNSYNFVCKDPIINPYIIKCGVKYNEKWVCGFIFKKNSNISKKEMILNIYNKIIKKYNLDKTNIIKFNIIWGDKDIKYTIQNDNLLLKNKQIENLIEHVPTLITLGEFHRKFILIYKNKRLGEFLGKKPLQAAFKAFESIVKMNRKQNTGNRDMDLNVDFTIQEVTKGSDHKYFYYSGTSKKLQNPIVIHIRGGPQFTCSVRNYVKKRSPTYNIYIKNQ